MRFRFRFLLIGLFCAAGAYAASPMPYAKAGLTEEQAAAVLLDRFTFGALPGEAGRVRAQGLDRWLEEQLAASEPEADLERRLKPYPAVLMDHRQMMSRFPGGAQSTAEARRALDLVPPADVQVDFEWASKKLAQFRKERGYQSLDELSRQLSSQKIVRATYARNQLAEVVTAFWLNHFHVTGANFRSRPWVLAYEKEAIRPNALGDFRTLLGAVARHPAKVQATLGEAQKAGFADSETTMGFAVRRLEAQGLKEEIERIRQQLARIDTEEDLLLQRRFWPAAGPNAEYVRLLLKQTVGDPETYSAADLETLAAIFTGWSTLPYGVDDNWFTGGFSAAEELGFVQEGSFVFRADRHDAREKRLWGLTFTAGGGAGEGELVLDRLSAQPLTATNISTAIAEQFAGPDPDPRLVRALATEFRRTQGDIRAVLRTLVRSERFWEDAARRNQEKSPFEYAVSALRASAAEIEDTAALIQWVAVMGEPLYAYADANGMPRNRTWTEGSLLTARVKFALALSDQQISGVKLPADANGARLALEIAGPAFQVR